MTEEKHYKLVIFDLDGTLLDTADGIIAATKFTIEQFGLHDLSDKQLKSFIGPPIRDSFEKAFNLESETLQNMVSVFRNRYKEVDLFKATPYSGIYELLRDLKTAGIRLAVATYKREDYALKLLSYFGFDKYFDVMHGADPNNLLKKADIIKKCIEELGFTDKNNVIMVGDTVSDEHGALNVGIDFIGVTYGFGYSDIKHFNNKSPVRYAATPTDVKKILLGMNDICD